MAAKTVSSPQASSVQPASWLPLIIILMAQMQMAFNVNAIPMSIGPIVDDLNTTATTVGTALVVYSLFVAAFVMLGAKIGKLAGERLVFQIGVLIHGLSMALMALSPTDALMINSQAIAGLAAAVLVPTLVVLIAANYHGAQQSQAFGLIAVIAYALSPRRAGGALATMRDWLERNDRLVLTAASLIFGLFFLFKGITGLIG